MEFFFFKTRLRKSGVGKAASPNASTADNIAHGVAQIYLNTRNLASCS